ncbi:hypothetical protein V7I10_18240 [Acinetobacter baumannii]|uniref:Uncharacterized protein n=2 Tax=Acinetobacter baumannii TaxID=470 RepID=A0A3R9U5W2_ACIBA|nr:hypothetical protein [Acinetobacter baumannii]ACJ41405.1 hypothetical protein AB57_2032 [Acinetobacter baumannii AB0057]EHU2801419.1 hypothetical protein [Acinetobacter baumannii]EHU2805479.1 hypothetical protein [Acinetobacter baumannii]EHU2839216.1 hypothetical protein [Acinetobacter baumannii]EHU2847157.1 hypothetical protein [Acinetobacter baumannii]
MEIKATNQVEKTKQPRQMTNSEKVILGVGATALSSAAFADVDASAGITVIGTAVAVIGLIGAAKIVPQATMVVWGYVKQAFNRT